MKNPHSLGLSISIALLLSACGGGSSSTTISTNTNTGSTTTASKPALKQAASNAELETPDQTADARNVRHGADQYVHLR